MDVDQTSYCTVLDKQSQAKFLCYTRREAGVFSVRLTDAADVWSAEYTEDTLTRFRQRYALKSTEDYILKLRSACGSGDVSIVVHDRSVDLLLGPGDLRETLSRLESPQATAELKELLFRMADGIPQPDSKCGSPSVSPVKNHQRRHAEFEPRQQQNSAPSMKKRLPGASLINPGAKRKQRATGVAFDDVDED